MKTVKLSPSKIKFSFDRKFQMYTQSGPVLKLCQAYKLSSNYILTNVSYKVFPQGQLQYVKGEVQFAADYKLN